MVTQLRAAVRRWLPIGRVLAWLRGLRERLDEPTLPLPSTYDEVIYDPKTDTYYGVLYPKEMREVNPDKPFVMHVVGEEPAPNGAAGGAQERVATEGTASSVEESPQLPPSA